MTETPVVVPSSGELQSWYTPKEARARAAAYVGDEEAAEAIWKRIRGNQIQLVAQAMTTRRDFQTLPEVTKVPQPIHPNAWYLHQDSPDKLWTGDVEFIYEEPTGEIDSFTERPATRRVHTEAYGIRLNPGDVDLFYPSVDGPQEAESETSEKPRVTDPHLAIWREAYARVYGERLALPHAVASAKGFFHDKTAARDRVHALFQGRTAGRKPNI